MVSMTLSAQSALDDADITIGTCRLHERSDVTLISVAVPRGGEKTLADKLNAVFGLALPPPTGRSEKDGVSLVRMAVDQYFLMGAREIATDDVSDVSYLTDQSDSWIVLELSGRGCLDALERSFPVDLHDSVFPVGSFARTQVEHMGAAILRVGPDTYWLMSARSSARSFWHAIETSLHYTKPADD